MSATASATRRARLKAIRALKAKGRSSAEIGRELNLAPSTVRDYLNDPFRAKARRRQRRYGVTGIKTVSEMHPPWKRSAPSEKGASYRGRQMRALTGYYKRHG